VGGDLKPLRKVSQGRNQHSSATSLNRYHNPGKRMRKKEKKKNYNKGRPGMGVDEKKSPPFERRVFLTHGGGGGCDWRICEILRGKGKEEGRPGKMTCCSPADFR